MRKFMFCMVLLTALTGCATTTPKAVDYQPLVLPMAQSREATFTRVLAAAKTLGWSGVKTSPYRCQLSAVAAQGTGMRDHIEIEVREGALAVAVHTELDQHGRWIAADVVPANYGWARERFVAATILDEGGQP
jgi:hypothetical protein